MNEKNGKFIPSKRLVCIIKRNLIKPDRETIEMMRQQGLSLGTHKEQIIILKQIISEEIDGFLTNLAKRICMIKETILISDNSEFTREVRDILVDRLGLDSEKNLDTTFKNLHKEMTSFFITVRKRKWGEIMADNSGIKIIIKDNSVFRGRYLYLDSPRKSR